MFQEMRSPQKFHTPLLLLTYPYAHKSPKNLQRWAGGVDFNSYIPLSHLQQSSRDWSPKTP